MKRKRENGTMEEKIIDIICANTYVDSEELKELGNDCVLTELGLDSINIVYVIGELEAEFGFTMKQNDMMFVKLDTVNKIKNLINSYKNS